MMIEIDKTAANQHPCSVDASIDSFVDPSESDEIHAKAFQELSKAIGSPSGSHKNALSIQDLVGRMEKQVSHCL